MEKAGDDIERPRLHHSDLAVLEDELKSEYDVLNGLLKMINTSKANLSRLGDEHRCMMDAMESLKKDLNGESKKLF